MAGKSKHNQIQSLTKRRYEIGSYKYESDDERSLAEKITKALEELIEKIRGR